MAQRSGVNCLDVYKRQDQLGASYASGVLMDYGQGEDEIVNYFETQEFEDYCKDVYKRQERNLPVF